MNYGFVYPYLQVGYDNTTYVCRDLLKNWSTEGDTNGRTYGESITSAAPTVINFAPNAMPPNTQLDASRFYRTSFRGCTSACMERAKRTLPCSSFPEGSARKVVVSWSISFRATACLRIVPPVMSSGPVK